MDDEPEENRPIPLDYQPPQPPRRGKNAAAVAGGIVTGVIAMIFLGFFAFAVVVPVPARSTKAPSTLLIVLAFLIAAACSLVVAIYVLRKRSSMFLAGLLIGAAVMGLIEGLCFAAG